MITKPIKLSPKKGGTGFISSYTVNFGSAEIRECGFVDKDGNVLPVEKVLDPDNNQIIIKLRAAD